MSYAKAERQIWERDVLAMVSEPVVAYRLGELFLAMQARIEAGDGCPDCGTTVGHTLPCKYYNAGKALSEAGVEIPGYWEGSHA